MSDPASVRRQPPRPNARKHAPFEFPVGSIPTRALKSMPPTLPMPTLASELAKESRTFRVVKTRPAAGNPRTASVESSFQKIYDFAEHVKGDVPRLLSQMAAVLKKAYYAQQEGSYTVEVFDAVWALMSSSEKLLGQEVDSAEIAIAHLASLCVDVLMEFMDKVEKTSKRPLPTVPSGVRRVIAVPIARETFDPTMPELSPELADLPSQPPKVPLSAEKKTITKGGGVRCTQCWKIVRNLDEHISKVHTKHMQKARELATGMVCKYCRCKYNCYTEFRNHAKVCTKSKPARHIIKDLEVPGPSSFDYPSSKHIVHNWEPNSAPKILCRQGMKNTAKKDVPDLATLLQRSPSSWNARMYKAVQCPMCENAYQNFFTLCKHYETKHAELTEHQFGCGGCGQTFRIAAGLEFHAREMEAKGAQPCNDAAWLYDPTTQKLRNPDDIEPLSRQQYGDGSCDSPLGKRMRLRGMKNDADIKEEVEDPSFDALFVSNGQPEVKEEPVEEGEYREESLDDEDEDMPPLLMAEGEYTEA